MKMEDWKPTVSGVLSSIAAALILAAAVASWSYFENLPRTVILILSLSAFVLVLIVAELIIHRSKQNKSESEEYRVEKAGQHLLAEIERNEKLGGIAAGNPECQHLEALITVLEDSGRDPKDDLLASLYSLRQRTRELESLSKLAGNPAGSQHKSHYLPQAKETKALVRNLVEQNPPQELLEPFQYEIACPQGVTINGVLYTGYISHEDPNMTPTLFNEITRLDKVYKQEADAKPD